MVFSLTNLIAPLPVLLQLFLCRQGKQLRRLCWDMEIRSHGNMPLKEGWNQVYRWFPWKALHAVTRVVSDFNCGHGPYTLKSKCSKPNTLSSTKPAPFVIPSQLMTSPYSQLFWLESWVISDSRVSPLLPLVIKPRSVYLHMAFRWVTSLKLRPLPLWARLSPSFLPPLIGPA